MIFDMSEINRAKAEIDKKFGMFDKMMEVAGVSDYDSKNKKCCCLWHAEDTPSLIYNSKSDNYSAHCFGSCHRNYDLIDVIMQKRGCTYASAVKELFDIAEIPYSFGEIGVKTLENYIYPHEEPIRERDVVDAYLDKRCLSKETADWLDIRQDEHGNIVFNYYDLNDVLTMVKYRPARKIAKGENKNWCQKGASTSNLLYNMNRVNPTQPVLICCGELDCASAIEAGWKNAVSIPLGEGNLNFIEQNFEWLESLNDIIVAYDNDDTGRKFLANVVPRLGSWRTKIVHIPDDCKDLNEVLFRHGKEKLLDIIVHAEDTPVPSVVDFSSVKAVDFRDMPGLKTGIDVIDKQLIKLPYGTITVLSGMPGSGKSSILSQIMCNTLEQGESFWLFSGELSNPISKSWISYVLAGRHNIDSEEDSFGDTYYCVNKQAQKLIDEYYKGRWFVYRDDWDNNIDTLIESMVDSIRKYGTKLVILDNLMVMMNDNADSELRDQTTIVKKLIGVAQKYSVAVILVAHPRKMSQTSTVGMFDISGTSNIVNLAHRTIGLRRVTDDEKNGEETASGIKKELTKYDVIVNIIKDRMRGRSSIQKGMFYDNISRRFYTTNKEYDRQYSWDTKTYDTKFVDHRIDEAECAEVFG